MNPYLFMIAAFVFLLAYVVYRLAFTYVGLAIRESMIPDVSLILNDDKASEKLKFLAKAFFSNSISMAPVWSPFMVFLLHKRKKIEDNILLGLNDDEMAIVKRLHMQSAMISSITNPFMTITVIAVAIPVVLFVTIVRGSSKTKETLARGEWVFLADNSIRNQKWWHGAG